MKRVLRRILFLALLGLCVMLLNSFAERHPLHLDISAQRVHSLSDSAAAALQALRGELQITAFAADYPVQRAQLARRLAPYLAHPSRPQFRFVDPLANPGEARRLGVRHEGELHLLSGQRREVVASADSAAIDAALNRLARQGERWVVSLRGHGEARIDDSPGGIRRFAAHLEQLGYRLIEVDPRELEALPENAGLLLIVAPQQDYDTTTATLIQRFLADGGALLWLFDHAAAKALHSGFGVSLLPGVVVDAAAARHGLEAPDNAIVSDYPAALFAQPPAAHSVLSQAVGLQLDQDSDWRQVARLHSSPRSWNETGDLHGRLQRDPQQQEQAGPIPVGLALQQGKDAAGPRAVLLGSAHLLGNAQIGQAANRDLALGLVQWLSGNRQLTVAPPAADLELRWSPTLGATLAIGLMVVLPAGYLLLGLGLRHRRRKA